MTKASGSGEAHGLMVVTEDNLPALDDAVVKERRDAELEAAVASAKRKVAKQRQIVKAAETADKEKRAKSHLAAAEKALASAEAAQKGK